MADNEGITPVTQAGRVLADALRRAKSFSGQIWSATSWLLTFLGAIAPFALIQQLSQGPVRDGLAITLVIAAFIAVIAAGLATFLVTTLTNSYLHDPDTVARKPARVIAGRKAFLTVLIVAQILCIPLATVLEAGAIYRALSSSDPDLNLNHRLAHRLDFYAAAPDQVEVVDSVKEYCAEHLADDGATDTFLRTCLRFNRETLPTREEAGAFAKELRDEIEARK